MSLAAAVAVALAHITAHCESLLRDSKWLPLPSGAVGHLKRALIDTDAPLVELSGDARLRATANTNGSALGCGATGEDCCQVRPRDCSRSRDRMRVHASM